MDFVHLHCHSQYSLMDGLCSPEELMAIAKVNGNQAIAITDHGTLGGHRELQLAAAKAGIKPILGVEAYISETDRFDKRTVKARDDNTNLFNHIILLAKNQIGLLNLQKLSGIAWTEGYYHKPRIDMQALDENGEGLIVLSGCMSGLISKAFERGDTDRAYEIANWFKDRFGDDFYIEVQSHNPEELNDNLLLLADTLGIAPIATSDCHFGEQSDRFVEEALLIVSTKPKVNPEFNFTESRKIPNLFDRLNYIWPDRPISFQNLDLFLQTRLEAEQAFGKVGIYRTDIFDNTIAVADKIGTYELMENEDILPVPKKDARKILTAQLQQGLKDRGLQDSKVHVERLDEELKITEPMGIDPYFLIVQEIVQRAKSEGIRVGPGRGSAAGSLMCYLLGITDVDPIEYNLLFYRFLNPERNDWPDIDLDFQDNRRGEVIAWLTEKFKHVAGISTYTYFANKGVVRDAARVFRVPLNEVNRALKGVQTFEQFEVSPHSSDFRMRYPEVIDLARKLRGRIRSNGGHPSGIVVSNKPLWNYTAVETRKDDKNKVSGRKPVITLDMNAAADVGFIKIDCLGLKTLSNIDDTLKFVLERHGIDIDPLEIPLDDPAIYKDLTGGFTAGVFQAEQSAYTKLLREMGVDNFEELVVSNALVRPGAANTVGKEYIARKKGEESVRYTHKILEDFTDWTLGLIVSQEQVMQTCVYLAGMSWSEADKIRKIIGKKKDPAEFKAYEDKFIEGASKHVNKKVAAKLWHDFEAFAGYGFNRAHSVAYSMITYWTAWLKHYYPLEYMTAVLRNEEDKLMITKYLLEAKRLGITMKLPHINSSQQNFTIEDGEDTIRFGLGNLKFMTDNAYQALNEHRPFATYQQILDLAYQKGSGISTRALDSMNAIGAAVFRDNPLKGSESDNYWEYLNIPKFRTNDLPEVIKEQVNELVNYEEDDIFISVAMVTNIKRGDGWSRVEMLDETGEAAAFHNADTVIEVGQMYLMLIAKNRIERYIAIDEVSERPDDVLVRWLNRDVLNVEDDKYVVISANPRTTKTGKKIINAVLSDKDKNLRMLMVFSKQFMVGLSRLKPGAVVDIKIGKLDDGTEFITEFGQPG